MTTQQPIIPLPPSPDRQEPLQGVPPPVPPSPTVAPLPAPHESERSVEHSKVRRIRPWFFVFQTSIFIGLLIGVVIPQIQSLTQKRFELDETLAQTSIVIKSTEQRLKTETDLVGVSDKSIIDASILPEEEVISFIETIEELATQYHVIQNISFHRSDRVVRNGLAEIPITIQIDGTWEDDFRFLAALEKEDFYINPITMDVHHLSTDVRGQKIIVFANSFWIP